MYIWTEIYRCGKIGKIAIDSFFKHHSNIKINIYGTPDDFKWITQTENVNFIDISSDIDLLNSFNSGHYGTAKLWAKIIKSSSEKWLVHFDSDVIFRKECISDLQKGIDLGYSIIGPIRNYKNNPNNRDDVRHLDDLSQTLFFAFDREKISPHWDMNTFIGMCQGVNNPCGQSVIDFFDPVQFNIIGNGGKVLHLDNKDYGGCDFYGKRISGPFPEENMLIDHGYKLSHFSAVGSGMNYYTNRNVNVPDGYVRYALEKYAIFCKIFYNEHINVNYDINRYKSLLDIKEWY